MVRHVINFGTIRAFEGTTIRVRDDGRVFILLTPDKMSEVPRSDRGFVREGRTAIRFEKRCLASRTVVIGIRTLKPPRSNRVAVGLGAVPPRDFRRNRKIRRLNS